MTLTSAPSVDIRSPDFSIASDEFRELRAEHWFVKSEMGFAILRYADCAAMLKDARLHQASLFILALRGVTTGPLVEWWTGTMLNLDGSEHTRLRRLVAKAFTPPVVAKLRPHFRAQAERLVDAFAADGTCEFVQAFSEPYPLEAICEMLSVPASRRAAFYGWAGDLGLIFSDNIGEPEVRARAEAGLAALYACADDVIADRRAHPDDDLVSLLIAAEAEGEHLTEQELRTMIVGLIFAGNDTTRNQTGLGVIAFSQYADQWTKLRERPELASKAVDEMMRLRPTISVTSRVVAEDVTYHGVTFPKGTLLQLFLASANADESVYGDAPFDIEAERPSPHLTFSGGIHRCLGLWLAKAEMEEALGVLSSRFVAILPNGTPTWMPGLGIDGPSTLPLRFVRP